LTRNWRVCLRKSHDVMLHFVSFMFVLSYRFVLGGLFRFDLF